MPRVPRRFNNVAKWGYAIDGLEEFINLDNVTEGGFGPPVLQQAQSHRQEKWTDHSIF